MFTKKTLAICGSMLFAAIASTLLIAGTGDTRIADAAQRRDIEGVRGLIKQAADVGSAQGDGMTALHWAALNADAAMTELLLNAGANVRATTRLGAYTPLFMAAKAGAAPVVEALLKAGANPKTPAADGITPLMMAASSGNAQAVTLLLKAGAEVNAIETERGQTALAFAAAFNQPDAIKVLLQNGADINKKSKQMKPAERPPQPGNRAQQQGQNPPVPQQAPTQQAPQRGQPAAPQAQQAAAQPQRGQQPQQGQGRGPQQQGQTANPRGELTALMYGARQGNLDAVRALVDGGANINEVSADRSTALLLASINGSFDTALFLVERGADVSIASMDGATPLYGVVNTQWAPKSDAPQPTTKYEKTHYLELVKVMLDRGGDPNARLSKELWYTQNKESTNDAGTTPFWRCAAVGDIDCMRLLMDRGANPNLANVDGVSALLVAAGAGFHGNNELTAPAGRIATVRYLVEELHVDVNAADTAAGADRNDTANTGRAAGGFTALHNAAARGDNEMILYLISKGAKVDAVSRNGTTVADMANGPRQRIQPYRDTIALLELLGSRNSYKCVSC
jgi:uncharacterized protein